MASSFDPGCCRAPFDALCDQYPDASVYPVSDFRVEWGPVFHRGRLDGSARVLVIGQDPAQHEVIARRILIGVAGHRVQGFLARLGVDRSYVMVNTFLYSLVATADGGRHRDDPGIVAYRNRWLDALLVSSGVEAVVALGALADHAWRTWRATPAGRSFAGAYAHVTHPTQPESTSGGDPDTLRERTAALLATWNEGLRTVRPAISHPDAVRPFRPYGGAFSPDDLRAIPREDLPAGSPAWMCGLQPWATRTGTTAAAKRFAITITVPPEFQAS